MIELNKIYNTSILEKITVLTKIIELIITNIVKAKELNRKFLATEINKEYIDNVISKRLNNE